MPDATRARALVIAVLGAESTGKSCLTQALAPRLTALTGLACHVVPEYLREWCEYHQRLPRESDQAHIAHTQAQRIAEAAQSAALVLADTTPLMTAVYHRHIFGSRALDAEALAWQRQQVDFHLLMALDLPWQADGFLRDGPQVRAPVDAHLREHLIGAGLPFAVVAGRGEARTEAALDALSPLLRQRWPTRAGGLFSRLSAQEAAQPRWHALCTDCDDPACEHAAWQQRQAGGAVASMHRS